MGQINDQAAGAPSAGGENDPILRIGALADSALDGAEAARVIDLLLESADLRRAWAEVHLVGDCLRSEETGASVLSAQFMERFSAQLAREPTVLTPNRLDQRRAQERWRRFGLPGASIAAAVAMVAWVAWPQRPATPVAGVARDASVALAPVNAPAGTQLAEAQRAVDPVQLREYLAAHEQFSAPHLDGMGSFRTAAWSTSISDNSTP